jgi:hypothetical protein
MTLKTSDILHSTKNHFVIKAKHGYEVYKTGITHATRCAQIGYEGQEGLSKAIAECKRRESNP